MPQIGSHPDGVAPDRRWERLMDNAVVRFRPPGFPVAAASPSPPLPIRIVHIDHDEDQHVLLSRLLAGTDNFPVELTRIGTFQAGLAAFSANAADVFLVDYRLGDRTGLELVSEGRRQGGSRPAIVLTGSSSREINLRAAGLGAADYLEKGSLTGPLLEHSVRCALRQWMMMTALKEANRELMRVQDQLENERAAVTRTAADLAAMKDAYDAQRRLVETMAITAMPADISKWRQLPVMPDMRVGWSRI